MAGYFDAKSGAVIPKATADASPGSYTYFDPKSGAVVPYSTVLANPGNYLYFDPVSGAVGPVTGGALVFRGSGARVKIPYTISGSGAFSRQQRIQISFPYDVRRLKFLFPTVQLQTSAGVDTRMTVPFKAQMAVETSFQNTVTGLAPRLIVPANDGTNVINFDPNNPAHFPGVMTGIIDLGVTIPAGTSIGLWYVLERQDGLTSGAWCPSGTLIGSAVFTQYEVNRTTTTTNINATDLAAAWVTGAVSVTATTTVGSGYAPIPLIEVASAVDSVYCWGSSTPQGTGEGANGSLISNGADADYGDTGGNARRMSGWPARLFDARGKNLVVQGIGSDQLQYHLTNATNLDRLGYMKLLNPTRILMQGFTNDVGQTVGGVTQIGANLQNIIGQIRAALGFAIPWDASTCTPNSTSTDSWATLANQTPTATRGPGQDQDTLNALLRSGTLGNASTLETVQVWESNYTTTPTGKFRVDRPGVANSNTQDGLHMNSYGSFLVTNDMVSRGFYNSLT